MFLHLSDKNSSVNKYRLDKKASISIQFCNLKLEFILLRCRIETLILVSTESDLNNFPIQY